MNKPVAGSIIIAGLLLALHCAKPNQPEEPPYFVETPMPDGNAELMALSLSGEILAPLALYERIHQDLEQIRCDHPSYFCEFCQIGHAPKFGLPTTIVFYIDKEMFVQLGENSYHAWDELNKEYQMVRYLAYGFTPHDIVAIFFGGRRHLDIMAQEYLSLPGFIHENLRKSRLPHGQKHHL